MPECAAATALLTDKGYNGELLTGDDKVLPYCWIGTASPRNPRRLDGVAFVEVDCVSGLYGVLKGVLVFLGVFGPVGIYR